MLKGIDMAMMNISDFVESWIGQGDEKQDTQRFWMDLFQNVNLEAPAKASHKAHKGVTDS